jgi:hypothetical protein
MGMARLGRMIEADPVRAEQWYKENKKDFLGADQAKAENALRTFLDQRTVDDLVARYGVDDENAVVSMIREKYSGAQADRLISRYRQRVSEVTIAENRADAQLRKTQQENMNNLYTQFVSNGLPVSRDTLDSMLRSRQIDDSDHRTALEWNAKLTTRANIEKRLRANDPEQWKSYTPGQREREIMLAAGRTQEERDQKLSSLQARVMDLDDPLSVSDINNAYLDMFITKGEAENLTGILKGVNTEQAKVATLQRKKLESDLKNVFNDQFFWNDSDRRGYIDHAKQLFMEKIYPIEKRSSSFLEEVVQARQEALLETYELSAGNTTGFLGDPEKFKTLIDGIVGGIDPQTEPGYKPRFRKDDIVLSGLGDSSGASSVAAMVPDGKPPVAGNEYDAPRDNGARKHRAIDIPAPEGSKILSVDFGTPLTVTDKKYSESAGNMIILEGTTADGQSVKVRALHLQNLEGPEKGATVASGDLIGYVGNTGSTSHGNHAHIDVTVNGKRVNPNEFLEEVAQRKAEQAIPTLDDLFGGNLNGLFD